MMRNGFPGLCRLLPLGAAAVVLLAGCRSEEKHGLMASGKAPPLVVHPEHADQPEEFARIVHMPTREVIARLGTFAFSEAAATKIEVGGKTAEALGESVRLEVGTEGQWHVVRDNSRDYGVEVWWLQKLLTVRMRYGKPVRRRPEGNEPERLLEDLTGNMPAYYDLVARFATHKAGGMVSATGRPAYRVAVELTDSPRGATRETEAERKWRERIEVASLAGQATIDAKSGVMLSFEIKARYRFVRDGQAAVADMQVKREISDVGRAVALALPQGTVTSPTRTRYEMERKDLLDGLVAERKSHGH